MCLCYVLHCYTVERKVFHHKVDSIPNSMNWPPCPSIVHSVFLTKTEDWQLKAKLSIEAGPTPMPWGKQHLRRSWELHHTVGGTCGHRVTKSVAFHSLSLELLVGSSQSQLSHHRTPGYCSQGEKGGWRRERREGKLQNLPIKRSEYVTSQISPEVSAIKHSKRKWFCFCLSDIVSKKQRKGVVSVRRLPSKRLQTEPCPCPRCCHFWSLSLLDDRTESRRVSRKV